MSVKKKVSLLVFNSFKNDSRVLKEATSLSRRFSVKVLAHGEDGLKKIEKLNGFNVKRFGVLNRNKNPTIAKKLCIYIYFSINVVFSTRKDDIIHCNDLNTLPLGIISKFLFSRNVRIIYDAHEYEIYQVPNQSFIRIKIKYLFEKFFIKYSDRVLTVSESIAREYVTLYGIERPFIILNAPPYQKFNNKNFFRENYSLKETQNIFLYQGGLSKGRGIEIILEAFEVLDEKHIIIFMGYGSLEELVKDKAKTSNNIFFHPAVSPHVLLDYTSSADFGIIFYENICLNHEYCSPNKLFEYMMAGLPVIGSNLKELKALIELENIGVVSEVNTPLGLKEAVDTICSKDKRDLINNIQKANMKYNWEKQELKLFEAYSF